MTLSGGITLCGPHVICLWTNCTCPLPAFLRAACALKCMGGSLQGRLWPRDEEERKAALELGYELNKVLHIEDLCKVEGGSSVCGKGFSLQVLCRYDHNICS